MKIWKRRLSRAEYWIGLGMLIGAGVVVEAFGLKAGSALSFVWLLLWAWRLHDFGVSGLWGLAPVGAMIVVAIAAFVLGGPEFVTAFGAATGREKGPATEAGNLMVLTCFLVLILIQLGFTAWLGVKRGDAGNNAYGAPSQLFRKN